MTFEARRFVDAILPFRALACEEAEAYAPANIALCKYWGKRDEALKLPFTGSLSASLGQLGTRTRLRIGSTDRLRINGVELPSTDKAHARLFGFMDLLRPEGVRLEVESTNTIPMAAGLASSASAFAAVVKALNILCGWELNPRGLSLLARLGSGSACRSVFEGFVEWHAGSDPMGLDSFAEPVAPLWPDFRIGVLALSEAEKPVGSSEGMRRTVATATLYQSWPAQVAQDLPRIRDAVLAHDFEALGSAAERNALAMHATMISAWPPVLYWRPETVETLHRVWALRREGLPVYATLDAGPNVKLLLLEKDRRDVMAAFPGLLFGEREAEKASGIRPER